MNFEAFSRALASFENHKYCGLCYQRLDESVEEVDREHVFPRWLSRELGLHEGRLIKSVQAYQVLDTAILRVHRRCNHEMKIKLEDRACLLVRRLLGNDIALSGGEAALLFFWMSSIYLKLVFSGQINWRVVGPDEHGERRVERLHRLCNIDLLFDQAVALRSFLDKGTDLDVAGKELLILTTKGSIRPEGDFDVSAPLAFPIMRLQIGSRAVLANFAGTTILRSQEVRAAFSAANSYVAALEIEANIVFLNQLARWHREEGKEFGGMHMLSAFHPGLEMSDVLRRMRAEFLLHAVWRFSQFCYLYGPAASDLELMKNENEFGASSVISRLQQLGLQPAQWEPRSKLLTLEETKGRYNEILRTWKRSQQA